MPSKNISQTKGDAGSQEVEWPDGPGTPQLREGPHASFLQFPARAPPITPQVEAGFTCPLQAELPILLQHGQGTEPCW